MPKREESHLPQTKRSKGNPAKPLLHQKERLRGLPDKNPMHRQKLREKDRDSGLRRRVWAQQRTGLERLWQADEGQTAKHRRTGLGHVDAIHGVTENKHDRHRSGEQSRSNGGMRL